MDFKVLGSGCAHCKTLEARTLATPDSLGLGAVIEKGDRLSPDCHI